MLLNLVFDFGKLCARKRFCLVVGLALRHATSGDIVSLKLATRLALHLVRCFLVCFSWRPLTLLSVLGVFF